MHCFQCNLETIFKQILVAILSRDFHLPLMLLDVSFSGTRQSNILNKFARIFYFGWTRSKLGQWPQMCQKENVVRRTRIFPLFICIFYWKNYRKYLKVYIYSRIQKRLFKREIPEIHVHLDLTGRHKPLILRS